MSPFTTKLVDICNNEWQFFDRSRIELNGSSVVGKREYDDGAWQRVGDYWRFIGGPHANLTGKDRGIPWSAAFVSWCMHEAGASSRFPYSSGHATYINRSIANTENGVQHASLIGHRLRGYRLRPGDLIGYWRGDKKITYESARRVGWYESHTDIIVDVGDGIAYAIGGNVMHSVTRRAVKLSPNGELVDRTQNWFIAISNEI